MHGHSYSGHAVGCTAAVRSIMSFKDPKKNPNLPPEGRVLREVSGFNDICGSMLPYIVFLHLKYLISCFPDLTSFTKFDQFDKNKNKILSRTYF